jgi:hypothetical protein
MSSTEIKEMLHDYINKADERMLKLMYAMAQADLEESEFELSEVHTKILDDRIKSHKANPTSGKIWK